MKLRNKKTGNVPEHIESLSTNTDGLLVLIYMFDGTRLMRRYDSIEAFNEEWEDYRILSLPEYTKRFGEFSDDLDLLFGGEE